MNTKEEQSSGGIVFRRREGTVEWLICQHSQHKGWVFPKGLIGDVREEESIEVAALREVKEEGGVEARIVDPTPVKVAYSYDWNEVRVHKTVYYYLMEYVSGDPRNHDWEMDEAHFASQQEVQGLLTYPSDKEAFAALLTRFSQLALSGLK